MTKIFFTRIIKRISICFLLAGIFFFSGCAEDQEKEVIEPGGEVISNVTEAAIEDEKKKEDEIDLANKIKSPLTGVYIDEEDVNDRVIAVMLDNQYSARPQAGISKCDIVYEILAEGNITRYMGILGTDKPDDLGPIRSARDYFIDRALEYDALYVHVGGSPQAYEAIPELKVASVDAMHQSSDIFWRKDHKGAPHNMYSSYEAIIKGANRKGYREEGKFETLSFKDRDGEIKGESLENITLPYYGKKYYSAFTYNQDEKQYHRYINGKPHLDEKGETPVIAKNIIVQFCNTRRIKGDTEGRRAIDMIGEGAGLYITNGKYIDITWKKSSERELTRYYDSAGQEVVLNPGKIWIQVYPTNRADEIIINEKEN